MRARGSVVLAVLAIGLLAPGPAFGSGYAIYEQGAEAMANAGAFTARADDPSALFFNPAGLLQLEGVRLDVGTNAIFLTGSEFESAGSGQGFSQEDNVAWPSSLYVTHKVSDRFAWGAGLTSPFGLKTEWGPTFEGRFISRESNLAVAHVGASAAFRVSTTWAVAAGIGWARADVRELSRNLDLSALCGAGCEGFTKLTGDGTDVGWNVAARWAGASGFRFGGSFRSRMNPEIEGEVDFTVPAAVAALFPDGGASATIPLPATLAVGVGYVSKGKCEGEFDIVWTDWSAFDRLQIDIENETSFMGTPVVTDVDEIEEWDDTYSFRFGYAYHVNDRHEWRAGAYFDRNPVPDDHVRPRLPDADRISVQIGYGFRGKGGFTYDVAYQALFFDDRTAVGSPTSTTDPVQPGEYGNFTSLLGVSVGWTF
jgi:long-chain fatty acid transport protein